MRIPPYLLAPFVPCGLAFGLASAAPTATTAPSGNGGLSKIPAGCEDPPEARRCLETGYLETTCGKTWANTCKPHLEAALKAQYEANAGPLVKMLSPNTSDMPKHLRDGKVVDYPGPKSKSRMAGTFPQVRTLSAVPAVKPSLVKPRTLATTMPSVTATKAVGAMGTRRPLHNLGKSKGDGKRKRKAGTALVGTIERTSDNPFSRTGLTRPPHSGLVELPVGAHRNPAWDDNGEKITSCEEYAYEQVYDWARYTDAVAACAGDHNCQLDISFLRTTPGIASRTLRRKDGTALATQFTGTTKKRELPKNDFFAYADKFVYAGGPEPLAPSADLDALAAVLAAGEVEYVIGCTGACGANEFADEWAFHRTMHDARRTVSMAEFEEYERRKARFRELASQYQAAVAAEKELLLMGRPKESLEWINPMDMVTGDPFDRTQMMRDSARDLRRNAKRMREKIGAATMNAMPGAGVKNLPVNGGVQLQGAQDVRPTDYFGAPAPLDFDAGGHDGTTGVLAAPTAGPVNTNKKPVAKPAAGGKPKQPATGPTPPAVDDAKKAKPQTEAFLCDPKKFTKIFETFGRGPISCEIGKLIREEWKRKKLGHKSCLDPDNGDCDWSPMMFEARFIEGVPYIGEQQAHETYCVDYTGDRFDPPSANLTAAKEYIDSMRAWLKESWKLLEPYKKTKTASGMGKGFGKSFTDADHFGDKDWLAAGYDYDLGWDVEPVKVDDTNVCQLGGGARGGFGVDAWFIGEDLEIVDALAFAEYNRKGDKQGVVRAHLNLFEGKVMVIDPEIDEHFSGSWEKPVAHGGLDIPMGYKPSFTFMAGPVPVTGAVWGEFFYGAKLRLDPRTEANCDMSKMTFGTKVTFTPEVGLNAKAQVGVGISGLISIGVRGLVNLVTVGVPVEINLATKLTQVQQQVQTSLGFDLDVRLSLATLSGWLALYMELLFFEQEFILFRWNGLGPESISLLGEPLKTEMPLWVMATK